MYKNLNIFGVANSFVWEMVESANRLGISLTCIDNFGGADTKLPNLKILDDANKLDLQFPAIAGIVKPLNRSKAVIHGENLGIRNWINLVDPTSLIASTAILDSGIYINTAVVVASNAQIGKHCVLNRQASVGHDSVLKDFVFLGPGAIVLGNVEIGELSYIGAGAIIRAGITVGKNCMVGAGAVVLDNVEDGQTVAGNPAKVLIRK